MTICLRGPGYNPFVISLVLSVALLAPRIGVPVPVPMQLFFVRHGETQANATGHYNSKTIDAFSQKGEKQVGALTKRLATMRFDAILVSPSPRALRTIAPFLRAHPGATAEVWPELLECCDAHSKAIHGLTSAHVRYGAVVKLPKDLVGLFTLPPDDNRTIISPSYDDGLRQIGIAADHLRKRFLGTGKSVLVVGHSLHGGRLIELLEGKPMTGKIRPENATIMRFREQPDGSFAPLPSSVGSSVHG